MLLNEGASLVLHVGHGEDDGWAGSFHVGALNDCTTPTGCRS